MLHVPLKAALLHHCVCLCLAPSAVCILAETEAIKAILMKEGIDVETVADVYPIRVQPARILSHIYARLGKLDSPLLRGVCPISSHCCPTALCLADKGSVRYSWAS